MKSDKREKKKSVTITLDLDITVLAIDSNHEAVTKIGFEYREKYLYPYLEDKGLTLVRCQGPLARRTYVQTEAQKPAVRYITGIGHGTAISYTGDYFDNVFRVGAYTREESQDKIVHLCSCETAKALGPDFVKKGCLAYFGYDEPFSFQIDSADIFFNCDSEVDRAFADGLPAVEVYMRVLALFDLHIANFRSQGALYKAATLEYNRDHLRSPMSGAQWGDKNANIYK